MTSLACETRAVMVDLLFLCGIKCFAVSRSGLPGAARN
jgi:hypothetical protein